MSTGSRIKADPQMWINVINRMMESKDYDFARDTLDGIRTDVADKDRITAKQINAIQNIRRGGDRL